MVRICICIFISLSFLGFFGGEKSADSESNELKIIMTGDALIHAVVYEDAKTNAQNLKSALGANKNAKNASLDSENVDFQNLNSQNEQNFENFAHITKKNKSANYYFLPMLEQILPIIAPYDLRYYNQETILGGADLGLSSYPAFNTPQEFGEDMLALGFNMVSLANNHTLDKGEKGVQAMLKFWHAKEKKHKDLLISGSYESAKDRAKPRIMKKNGISYAMLSYTYGTNGIKIPSGKQYLVNVYTKEMIRADVENLRAQVDLLIVAMHWGEEYTHEPTKEQQEMSQFLADLGVDLVIGNHPHVLQPLEIIGDTFVIYSLGNFISGQNHTPRKIGALVGLTIQKSGEKLIFKDLESTLIYTKSYGGKNFKLYTFENLTNEILPNFKQLETQYNKILFSRLKAKF